jgi:hypothetical protein
MVRKGTLTIPSFSPPINTPDRRKQNIALWTKDKKIPLLWKVLGNIYKGKLELSIHKDSRVGERQTASARHLPRLRHSRERF